jgi:hypothetical protein
MYPDWDFVYAMLPFAIVGGVFMGIALKAQEIKSAPLRGVIVYPSFAVGLLASAVFAVMILFNMFDWIPLMLWTMIISVTILYL